MTKKATRWSRRAKVVSAVSGCVLVAAGAYAATNWVVGLTAGSSGEGQSATIANLSITAVASPAPSNVLFPGGTGDVVVTIANTNSYPVTITAVNLPTNTTQAGGFTTSALSTAQTGCSTTTSAVTWSFATATSGSSHTLSAPLTVGAERGGEQPARGHAHQRRHHGLDLAGGVRQHLLLHALLDRDHGDRWRSHLDHEPGHRRLDELIAPFASRGPTDSDEESLRVCRSALLVAVGILTTLSFLVSSGSAWGTPNWVVQLATSGSGEAHAQALPAAPVPTSACTRPASSRKVTVTWAAITHATNYGVYQATTSATGTYTLQPP